MRRWVATLATAVMLLGTLAAGCASIDEHGVVGDRQVRVATTTNFITDIARQIGGDRVSVTGLMGPGVDPHLFKASASDVATLRQADLVLYGGLDLEGRMEDLFEELSDETPTVAVTDGIPRGKLHPIRQAGKTYDPHVWFDVRLYANVVGTVADAYIRVDPAHAAEYRARAAAYRERLLRLDNEVRRTLSLVPQRSRVLITSHDAFGYFGAAYNFEVVAIQGTSTATEASTGDIERVSDVIARRDLRSVFVESSVSPQTIRAVLEAAERKGQRARIGGQLFSDAAGDAGTEEGTYIGMVRHNARLIATGLGGTSDAGQ